MERWIEIIVAEASRRWRQNSLLLLSQIPSIESKAGINLSALQAGRTLLSTLREEASQHLAFYQNPEKRAAWAVLARDDANGETVESVFSRELKSNAEAPQRDSKRLMVWFWSAFIKQLDPGKHRWILDGSYIDAYSELPPRGAIAEVLADEIAYPGQDVPADAQLVQAKIDSWSSRTEIKIDRFLAIHSSQSKPDGGLANDDKLRQKTILDLSGLDAKDIQRIYVPLDIVLKLLAS